jgi:hypothetical protein
MQTSKLDIADKRIKISGSKRDRLKAHRFIDKIYTNKLSEAEARLLIQDAIDEHSLKASILFSGNGVWSRNRVMWSLDMIIEHGTLYKKDKPYYHPIGSLLRMPVVGECWLSDYFYYFLHLCCGSIAHYSKRGWVTEYPTVEDLKRFFIKNEFGKRVLDDIPGWKTDAKRIVEMIEEKLGITEADVEAAKDPPMFKLGFTSDGRIVYVPNFPLPPRRET